MCLYACVSQCFLPGFEKLGHRARSISFMPVSDVIAELTDSEPEPQTSVE